MAKESDGWQLTTDIGVLYYYRFMTTKEISGGVVHKLPDDLRKALVSDNEALAAWEDITPLARNEWICWTVTVKQQKTRDEHVRRVVSELKEGMRRPCCWIGCIHRKDKPISPSVQFVLDKQAKKHSTSEKSI
jgi:hypothetical protein